MYFSVTKFAKATGDYPSLSAVDIRIMALSYQLTKEHLGLEATARLLKMEPENVKTVTVMGSGKSPTSNSTSEPINPDLNLKSKDRETIPEEFEEFQTENSSNGQQVEISSCTETSTHEDKDHESCSESAEDSEEEEVDEEDDDEEGGWITPSNYKNKLKQMENCVDMDEKEQIPVACLTTDFAMQVLIEMLSK